MKLRCLDGAEDISGRFWRDDAWRETERDEDSVRDGNELTGAMVWNGFSFDQETCGWLASS